MYIPYPACVTNPHALGSVRVLQGFKVKKYLWNIYHYYINWLWIKIWLCIIVLDLLLSEVIYYLFWYLVFDILFIWNRLACLKNSTLHWMTHSTRMFMWPCWTTISLLFILTRYNTPVWVMENKSYVTVVPSFGTTQEVLLQNQEQLQKSSVEDHIFLKTWLFFFFIVLVSS